MTAASLVRVPGRLVQVGVPLPFSLFSAHNVLLLAKGQSVKDEQQWASLQRIPLMGLRRELEPLLGTDLPEDGDAEIIVEADTTPKQLLPFAEVQDWIRRAQSLVEISLDFKKRLLALARDIRALVNLHPEPAMAGIFLVPFKQYSAAHAVHCAILAASLEGYLQLDEKDALTLIQAVLVMNISVQSLQDRLFFFEEKLSKECWSILHSHPGASAKILRERGITDEALLTAVAQHHETPEGTGYPCKCKEGQISQLALLAHTLDVVAAKLTHRGYRAPVVPHQAMAKLLKVKGSAQMQAVVQYLVKHVGLYPPGTFVLLQNGETGVCVSRGSDISQPMVNILLNPDGTVRLHPKVRQVGKGEYAIAQVIPYTELASKFTNLNAIFGFKAN